MTIVRTLIIFLLVLLGQTSYATTKTILVMGDSLSAGYGIKPEEGWVWLLAQDLEKKYPVKFVNASVSGETTSGGLSRFPAILAQHKPKIVILELGANDGLRGQPLKLMQQNLQAMITASQAIGAKVLLLGIQIPTNYGARYTNQFKEIYPLLAQQNNIPLVPFFLEGVALHPDLIQADGLHPNAQAQPIIMNNVKPDLLKIIKENGK